MTWIEMATSLAKDTEEIYEVTAEELGRKYKQSKAASL